MAFTSHTTVRACRHTSLQSGLMQHIRTSIQFERVFTELMNGLNEGNIVPAGNT